MNMLVRERYQKMLKHINYKEVYNQLSEANRLDFSYLAMVIISAHIATLGLITNSPAVIIGAMIISPLMGPIMAGGLAFAIGDARIGRGAFQAISIGLVVSVGFAALITLISPTKDNTAEILARTSPNILDLFIALFCGLAGAFAATFRKNASSIVGVAISVALMPPLCVTGFGISTGQPKIILGSFLLFFTNLTAIFIVSTVFFLIFGFFNKAHLGNSDNYHNKIIVRYSLSLGLLLILSLPLMYTLRVAMNEKAFNNSINTILVESFDQVGQSRLNGWKLSGQKVTAQVDTLTYIEDNQINSVVSQIYKTTGREINLDVIQTPVFSLLNGQDKPNSLLYQVFSGQNQKVVTVDTTAVVQEKDALKNLKKKYPLLNITEYELGYDSAGRFKQVTVNTAPDTAIPIEMAMVFMNSMENELAGVDIKLNSKQISVNPVYFEHGQTAVKEGEFKNLDLLSLFLKSQKQYHLQVTGYTDSTGNSDINQYLSRKRAEAVREYLLNSGIIPERITINSQQNTTTAAAEEETGRQSQRRAEMVLSL